MTRILRQRFPALAFLRHVFNIVPVNLTIAELTERLVDSYSRVGGINHLDGKNLPSKSAIVQITVDLLRLLFPGFFDERVIHSSKIRVETTVLLESVMVRLEDEIYKSLEYHAPGDLKKKEFRAFAKEVAFGLIQAFPGIREILQTDMEAAYQGDPAALSKEEVIVAYPFVEAIAVHRAANELYRKGIALLPRIMSEWAHSRTGMDLHPGASIGSYFFVDHCTGTVVGETSIIGNHVKMYQGVALIARSLSGGQQLRGTKRHPTIEDHVTIYAGSTIMGGDTVVGAGSTVGANVFLSHSVPARSLVLADDVKVRVMSKLEKNSPVLNFEI
ncbi:MAG: serine acetyltransferase [Verrucomicrobiota bacterium]